MEKRLLATYSMRGNAVVIHRGYGNDMVLNEKNLKQSIENVKNLRHEYATEEAWRDELQIREDALRFAFAD